MYYSNINDDEVKQFHKKIKLTAGYTELNDLDTDLFDETHPNKCIPLFYCDTITGNENLRIIDNKLIIYSYTDDLKSVEFTSKNTDIEFGVEGVLNNNIIGTESYIDLHFYNNKSIFDLSNFEFHIKENRSDGIEGNYTTDKFGNAFIKIKSAYSTFTITCKETGQTKVIS